MSESQFCTGCHNAAFEALTFCDKCYSLVYSQLEKSRADNEILAKTIIALGEKLDRLESQIAQLEQRHLFEGNA